MPHVLIYPINAAICEKLSKKYRQDSIRAAKQLCYGKNVIAKIMNAQSDSEISNILHDARLA